MIYNFSFEGDVVSREGVSSIGKNMEESGMLKELGEALKELEDIDWSQLSTSTEETGVDSETTTLDLNSTTVNFLIEN